LLSPLLTSIFLVALGFQVLMQIWLASRQIRYVRARRDEVPSRFHGIVSPADHKKAADYTVARQQFGIVEDLYDAAVLILLTLGGGIAWLGSWSSSLAAGEVTGGTLHVLSVLGVMAVLGLPFSIYRTFMLEARYGFNRTTPRLFLLDLVKAWLLGAVIGGAIVAVVLKIMSSSGRHWWVLAWLAWLLFSLIATWAWPRFIAPLFNRFTPLADDELQRRIDALLARCGFEAESVYVMDGSRRSSHGNAYFTGLGRHKRIVLFDTLLSTLSPPQAEAVLAHELAHFKLRHVPQRIIVGALVNLAGFALLGWLSSTNWFYESLGVPTPSNSSALLLFLLVTPVFTWFLAPLFAAWSRFHEFEADRFAARHSDGEALSSALLALYRDNASTLTPDPVYSGFHDSHPPPATRIRRLDGLRDTRPSGTSIAR